jgi:cytosine/adenosine deaminase-related metal-dependent hydrolase
MEFTGNIYYNGKMRKGTLKINDETTFIDNISNNGMYGTLIPMPVNAHTHTGDSFISEEPEGNLVEIVGPGGFKHRQLESATDKAIVNGMEKSNHFMEMAGTLAYFDFRENGIHGVELLKNAKSDYIKPVVLGRPFGNDGINDLIEKADGIGLSSISDMEYEKAMEISEIANKKHKITALHFSENVREDIDKILNLKPDMLVHGIEASKSDLEKVKFMDIPVVITPRSNIFYGKNPDYGKFKGNTLMLGTDNVFITEPDIFAEMDFLYRYQRFKNYISPNEILKFAIENPRKFMEKMNITFNEKYIFFKNILLNEYQIVTKKHYFKCENIIINE